MTHIHHYIPSTSFNSLVNDWENTQDLIEKLRIQYVQVLEGTSEMDGKEIWTSQWDEQARRQMNINIMHADQFSVSPHVLYLPLPLFRQISNSQWKASQILLDTTHCTLSVWDGSIAPVLSDKDNIFMYRTSLGVSRQLEDTIAQLQEKLWEVADLPEELFFEWLRTNPDDIKVTSPWIRVEWYKKDHRIDESWSFQAHTKVWAKKAWKLIEWIDNKDGNILWNWDPQFSFRDPQDYYHVLPKQM